MTRQKDTATRTLRHQAQSTDAGRVDVLVARLTTFARARVRGLIDHGGIEINASPCTDAGARIAAGDVVKVTFDPKRQYREKPAERATRGFKLVYSDDHLVIVEKDSGILTVPTGPGAGKSLVDLVSSYLGKGQSRRGRVSVVHRLDRDTSGLLVFGRSPELARKISDQFAARKPEREYAAIVAGLLPRDKGTIRSHLATDKALNQRSIRGSDTSAGELAITHYEVKERFRDTTLVAVHLETGRRNQIRAHMAELGHPVLGDTRYAVAAAKHDAWPYARLALHARVLGFQHPVTGQPLRFESRLPREFDTARIVLAR